ncbi:MAG: M81 family metallopeptidase [Candidatus Mariimomonas ferrooxydans]
MPDLKIAIGQIWQEQNTFSPVKTVLEDFKQFGLYYGDEIMNKFSEVNELGGFIKTLTHQKNIKIIPTIRAWSWPKGNVEPDTFKYLKGGLLSYIKNNLPFDGVLISFHGAMASDSQLDVEGDILESIKREVGIGIPVVISCDLHANITARMLKFADYIEGYHTCPHIDLFRTGQKAAEILLEILNKKIVLDRGFLKLPLITPARAHDSSTGPFKKLFDKIKEIENLEGVKGASLFPVQPWLDVPELGWSTIVYSEKGKIDPKSLAKEIAGYAWQLKEEFFLDELSPEEAIEEAKKMKTGLMVVSDSDATTAGSPGDNTIILEAMMKSNIDFPVFLCFIDPEIVEKSIDSGIGNKISGMIGGKMDNIYCNPVKIEGTIKNIVDGKFSIDGHVGKNFFDMGQMCIIETGNINILVSENNGPFYEETVYKNAGLEPLDFRMLVVKSPVGFRYAFKNIADRIAMVQHVGFSSSDLRIFKFKNISRPLYPFDKTIDLEI